MKRILLTSFICLIFFGSAFAEEILEEHLYIYEFPKIKTKFFLTTGYRFVEIDGAERAAEYEYLEDSPIFLGELRSLPFPHRIHLETDFFNKKDYFSDISYAYKDIILSRCINRSTYHNLDNIKLTDLGNNERFSVDYTDISEKYGITSSMNTAFLRLKMPDFPFHVYMDGKLFVREGQVQQRFLNGSGFYNELKRTSKKRDIEHETRDVKIGVNTHLGPLEIDFSHAEKRFNAESDRYLYDFYSAGSGRTEGTYPHNIIPDLKGSKSTLKLHTSYTGKLVASFTVSQHKRENEYSGAEADYFGGSADLTWMPITKLTFFFKYRHKEMDIENPETVTIIDKLNDSNYYTYLVRKSISSKQDIFSGNMRYRIFKGTTLNAEISHSIIDRENTETWNLPKTTAKDMISLSINTRLLKNLNIRSKYIHEEMDEPSYNIESDSKDKGIISLSWTPLPYLFTNIRGELSFGKRDDLHYTINNQDVTADNGKRTEGKLFGNIGISISKHLSLNTSYAYITYRTKQALVYGSNNEPQVITDDTLYKEKVHTFGTNLNYKPTSNLALCADFTYTESSSDFSPSASEATEPVSISSFSKLKIKETEYKFSGEYIFKKGWNIGFSYFFNKFDDAIENLQTSNRDGEAHIILLSITKRWQ